MRLSRTKSTAGSMIDSARPRGWELQKFMVKDSQFPRRTHREPFFKRVQTFSLSIFKILLMHFWFKISNCLFSWDSFGAGSLSSKVKSSTKSPNDQKKPKKSQFFEIFNKEYLLRGPKKSISRYENKIFRPFGDFF